MKSRPMVVLPLIAFAWASTPAFAQDHSAHGGQESSATPPAAAGPHAGHGAVDRETAAPSPDPHAGHVASADIPSAPRGAEDGMDHSMMGHGATNPPSPGPEMETPPPPEAGSGLPRAADAIWGADAMLPSRRALQQTHGDYPLFWFQADRAEVHVRDGEDGYLWDVQGYYGGTTSRFWFKSEGEGNFGEQIEDVELQALYSRAIGPFADLQAGIRQDLAGPETTYAVIGLQGLARYMFEFDGAVFLSHRGDVTARLEAELDQRITQVFILQPRAEVNLAAQDVAELGIGAGIDSVELGVRLRYEITREFAPYVGIEQSWRIGRSADLAKANGEDTGVLNFVAGVRFWF